jgi:hypothetical protein
MSSVVRWAAIAAATMAAMAAMWNQKPKPHYDSTVTQSATPTTTNEVTQNTQSISHGERLLPTFGGLLNVGLDKFVYMHPPDGATDLPRKGWFKLGERFGDYELLFYDSESHTLIVQRNLQTIRLRMRSANAVEGDSAVPLERDEAVRKAHAFVDTLEERLRTSPGYQAYDPEFENKLTPSRREKLTQMRTKIAAVDRNRTVMVFPADFGEITTVAVQNPQPDGMRAFSKGFENLTAEDWEAINVRMIIYHAEQMVRAQNLAKRNKK